MWLIVIQLTFLCVIVSGDYFECPSNETNCVVDCSHGHTNSVSICNAMSTSIINATSNVMSLTVICGNTNSNSFCNNLEIECPNTSFLNITGSLQNSTINAITANKIFVDQSNLFNNNVILADNAQILNINIQQTFINNNIYINNISLFNLKLQQTQSQNNNIYALYANQLHINMKSSVSTLDKIYANNATKIVVNTANNTIMDTEWHAMFTTFFTVTSNHIASITKSIFYLNFSQNVSIFINDNLSSFSANILHVLSSKYFSTINKGTFSNNSINANNITLFDVSCVESCLYFDGIWNVINAQTVLINMNKNVINLHESAELIFNGIINASNATNINLNIGPYASLSKAQIDANNASDVTLNINGKFTLNNIICTASKTVNINTNYNGHLHGNNITVSKTQNVNFNVFGTVTNNIIYGEFIKKKLVLEIYGEFVGNILNIASANSLLITNKGNYSDNKIFGDNMKTSFNMSCIDNFTLCSSITDQYNVRNVRNVSLFINSSYLLYTHSFFNHFMASKTKFVDIYVGSNSQVTTQLNVENSYKVLVQIDGDMVDSLINGHNIGQNLSVICNGTDFAIGGCQNLTIYTSPVYNYLNCIKYGCKTLDIFTRNNANDIAMSSEQCRCNDNIINSCIEQWHIYCQPDANNQYVVSTFNGGRHCEGIDCCGDIVNMLHEDSCPWPENGVNNTDATDVDTDTDGQASNIGEISNVPWIIPLIIGSVVFLIISCVVISVFFKHNKKQQKKRDEKVNKMEFVSVSKLTNDTIPIQKPKQQL